MFIDSFTYGATSIITNYFEDGSIKKIIEGTGFFYQISERVNNGPFYRIKETYLVTNRHLFFSEINDNDVFTHKLVFGLKLMENNKTKIMWDLIELNESEIISRTKVERSPKIDVAIIKIGDIIKKKISEKPLKEYVSFLGVSNTNFPSKHNNEFFTEVGDDVLIIGYPYGYYDSVNIYPIVKSGIIATSLYNNFEGDPCFLIDAKLFPGSSGSLVISKPKMFRIVNEELMFTKHKQFDFLGVFSGEPYKEREGKFYSFNVGKVWKWNVVEFIINNGVSIKQ